MIDIFLIFVTIMQTTLIALSPEEKMQRYMDINNISNSTSYLNYTPNPVVAQDTKSTSLQPNVPTKFPTIDYTGMVPPNPLLSSKPSDKLPKAEEKYDPSKPIPNPYASVLAPFAPTSTAQIPFKGANLNEAAKEAFNYYVKDKKLPTHVAAGIVGNLYQESALQTGAVEKGGTQAGRGIAQWDKNLRWPALQKWAQANGRDPMDLKTQLDYVLVEPGWGDTALKKTMLAKNTDDATMLFGRSFERPSEAAANWEHRKGVATALVNQSE